jgi:hypothetical protein
MNCDKWYYGSQSAVFDLRSSYHAMAVLIIGPGRSSLPRGPCMYVTPFTIIAFALLPYVTGVTIFRCCSAPLFLLTSAIQR